MDQVNVKKVLKDLSDLCKTLEIKILDIILNGFESR
jgi:hypothetical protein